MTLEEWNNLKIGDIIEYNYNGSYEKGFSVRIVSKEKYKECCAYNTIVVDTKDTIDELVGEKKTYSISYPSWDKAKKNIKKVYSRLSLIE